MVRRGPRGRPLLLRKRAVDDVAAEVDVGRILVWEGGWMVKAIVEAVPPRDYDAPYSQLPASVVLEKVKKKYALHTF